MPFSLEDFLRKKWFVPNLKNDWTLQPFAYIFELFEDEMLVQIYLQCGEMFTFALLHNLCYHFKNTKLWCFVCTWMWDALACKVHSNLQNLNAIRQTTGSLDVYYYYYYYYYYYTAHMDENDHWKCCTLPQTSVWNTSKSNV